MNKEDVINKIMELTNLSKEDALKVDEAVEAHFIIGKNNKEKIVNDIKEKLNIDENKADEIYNQVMEIIATGIKEKIAHPFKSLD